jgi:hypothetical protein
MEHGPVFGKTVTEDGSHRVGSAISEHSLTLYLFQQAPVLISSGSTKGIQK